MSRRAELLLLALLLAVAAGLRFWGLGHGLPRNYVADSTAVRAALSIGAGVDPLRGEELPTQYPYLMPYLLFVVYGTFFVAGWLLGVFDGLGSFAALAFARPELFFLAARVVVSVAGCLVVLAVFLVGRRLATPAAGLWAGLFTATSLTQVQLSHLERPHVLATLFVVASLLFALRFRAGGSRDLLASSGLAALAGSTVPYGFFAAALPLAAAVGGRRRPGWRGAAIGALVLFVGIVVLCYPRALVATGASFGYDSDSGVVRYFGGLLLDPQRINGRGFARLGRFLLTSEPTLALAAAAGLVHLGRSPDRSRWLLVAVYPSLFLLVYGSYEVVHPRYLVSLIPFLALVAGRGVDRMTRWAWSRGALLPRWLAVAALILVFAPPAALALRLDLLLSRTDTRLLAETWGRQHLPPQAWVGLEAHGVELPPHQEALDLLADRRPERLGIRDRQRLQEEPQGGWRTVRLWLEPGYRDRDWRQPRVGRQLDYVALVVPAGVERQDRFYRSVAREGERLRRFSPLASSAPAETDLPNDLEQPVLDLWRLERPGPVVEIWRLPLP